MCSFAGEVVLELVYRNGKYLTVIDDEWRQARVELTALPPGEPEATVGVMPKIMLEAYDKGEQKGRVILLLLILEQRFSGLSDRALQRIALFDKGRKDTEPDLFRSVSVSEYAGPQYYQHAVLNREPGAGS